VQHRIRLYYIASNKEINGKADADSVRAKAVTKAICNIGMISLALWLRSLRKGVSAYGMDDDKKGSVWPAGRMQSAYKGRTNVCRTSGMQKMQPL